MTEFDAHAQAMQLWDDYQSKKITLSEMIERLNKISQDIVIDDKKLEKPLEIFDAKILGEFTE